MGSTEEIPIKGAPDSEPDDTSVPEKESEVKEHEQETEELELEEDEEDEEEPEEKQESTEEKEPAEGKEIEEGEEEGEEGEDEEEEGEEDEDDDEDESDDEPEKKIAGTSEPAIKYIHLRGRKIPLNYLLKALYVIAALVIIVPAAIWLFSDTEMIDIKAKSDANKDEKKEVVSKQYTELYFLEIPHFIVTIVDDVNNISETIYFKIKLSFELKDAELKAELEEKMPKIRDSIVNIITNKKISEIDTTAGKLKLKDDIRNYINSFLQGGSVTEVYFTEFVYQF